MRATSQREAPGTGASESSSGRATGPGTGSTRGRRTHDGYRHEAFLWRGNEEFLAGTVPFVREGLAAGQPVMAAVTPARIQLLAGALGDDADLVEFVDMTRLGANPARIIPAWRRFTEQHAAAGRAVRGIGEPIWHGRRPVEVAECQLHEALLNMAVEPDTPLWLLCPYDVVALPADVVAEAHRSHPVVVDVERHRGSSCYGGAHHVGAMFEADLPVVEVAVSHRVFGPRELGVVRADVTAHALSAGLPQDRSADLALAVHEVVVNSVEHGGGRGELRIWQEDRALVCEVRGGGRIADPMAGRRAPADDAEGGRGLWMANQLCDLVQIRSAPGGTTVRIHSWL
jgi:anti-sigma regulatory factor (Ser/Thr protein kinase)